MESKNKKNNQVSQALEAPQKLKILVTIINRSKAQFFLDVLEGYEINLQTVIYAEGTAPSEMLQFLGLNETNKAVIISVVREDKIKDITIAFEDKYFKTKNGKGIAFTIPISSMIGVSIYKYLCNNLEKGKSE